MRYFKYDVYTNSFYLLKEQILLTSNIYKLYSSDTSVDKSYTFKILCFTYLVYDLIDSPYINLPEQERIKKALETTELHDHLEFKDGIYTVINSTLIGIIDEYKQINTTITMESSEGLKDTIRKINEYNKSAKLTERTKDGKLVHSPTDITNSSKSIPELIKKQKELEKIIDMELESMGISRGAKGRTPIERKMLKTL